jgi:hypothetical protein
MALQGSGAISISQIRTELGSGSYSLRTLSAAAGKSTPDAMSEFYGYSAGPTYTFYGSGYGFEPCNGSYQLYEGSDGNWYRSFNGGATYILRTSDLYLEYGYYDSEWEEFIYIGYQLDFGPSLSFFGAVSSYCAPLFE